MDFNTVIFFGGVVLVLLGGLYAYEIRGVPSDTINKAFGYALVIGAITSALSTRTGILLPGPCVVVMQFMIATGFVGLITDGVIFKFWKVRPSVSAMPQQPNV